MPERNPLTYKVAMESPVEKRKGIEAVDLTTSGWLFKPEDAFRLANAINKDIPNKDKRLKIEVYPTVDRLGLMSFTRRGTEKFFGLHLPLTPEVTADAVKYWQSKDVDEKGKPYTEVSRVHLPFSYNKLELLYRPFFAAKGMERIYQIMWILEFGAATNMKGVELARRLREETGQEVGVNAHMNVLAGLIKDERLDELKESVAFVLGENEMAYNPPKSLGTDKTAISDPTLIAEICHDYGLDGMLLGVDHMLMQGMSATDVLDNKNVTDQIRALHLAGSEGNHGIVAEGDPVLKEFLQKVAETEFRTPVKAALDLSPLVVGKLSYQQQLDMIKNAIKYVMNSQDKPAPFEHNRK